MPVKNIVLFGMTGAGKSSVVNLMAGEEVAKASPDMNRCTLHWEQHHISFDERRYNVFDTMGLEDPQLGKKEYLEVIVNAYDLIEKLKKQGGIDLLVFCVRAGRFTAALQTNYLLFYEWLCEKKVPLLLVFTGLERETIMENWWDRNKHLFDRYNIEAVGHACITAASGLEGRHQKLYEESRHSVRTLVANYTYKNPGNPFMGDEGWFQRFIRKLASLFIGKADVETVLTRRCRMPAEIAKELASRIRVK